MLLETGWITELVRRAESLRKTVETLNLAALPDDIRAAGWRVAVHNDYKLDCTPCAFWLFTHSDGRWIKGEGYSDAEALNKCRDAIGLPRR